jgi:hypothetical protein
MCLGVETLRIKASVMHRKMNRYMSMSREDQVKRLLINVVFFFMDFMIDTPLIRLIKHIMPFMSTHEEKNIHNL